MEESKPIISVHKIIQFFSKAATKLDEQQLKALDEELKKIYPTEKSEVSLTSSYSEEDNSIGISIFLSHPIQEEPVVALSFNQLMSEYLIRADIAKLPQVFDCINLLEKKEGQQYTVDFIPVFYTEAINKHDIHLRISKN